MKHATNANANANANANSNPERETKAKAKTLAIVQRQLMRANSAPTLTNAKNSLATIKQPPIVLTGSYNGSPITVYGEIHNKIDNRFYETIDLTHKIVMVEHSTKLCKISNQHKILLLNKLKGSEWIWYKYAAQNRPMICIDNRMEIGLLTAIEENYLINIEKDENIEDVIIASVKVMQTLDNPKVQKMFIGKLKEIYDKFTEILDRQISIIAAVRSFEMPGILNIKDNLINNIIKVSSFIVDLNIYQNIIKTKMHPENKDKEIVIFAGMAHAYRLHKYFPKIFNNLQSEFTMKELEEDYKLDKLIFEDEEFEEKLFTIIKKSSGIE